jgi:hypothetical protein
MRAPAVSRGRLAALAALALAGVVVALLLLTGSAGGEQGKLVLAGKTTVVQSGKPTDRVLVGKLRNDSLKDIDLRADDVRVLAADGREIRSTARFLAGFAHPLFAWSQEPKDIGDYERTRLGEMVTIKPGETAPLVLSWRLASAGEKAERADFGPASITLP